MLRLLLARLVELGARHARPGEFSERAFLNGKLDLAQAEAVADLIASGSETAARAALRSLDGEFSRRVRALTAAVVRLRVWIEAAIDFPEEEIDFLVGARAARRSRRRAHRSRRRCSTARAAACGSPTACTSSSSAGRTPASRASSTRSPRASARSSPRFPARRAISCAKRSSIDGVALTLVDTAGLRESRRRRRARRHPPRARRARARRRRAARHRRRRATPKPISRCSPTCRPARAASSCTTRSISAIATPHRERRGDDVHLWLSAKTGAGLELLHAELRESRRRRRRRRRVDRARASRHRARTRAARISPRPNPR